MFNYKNKFDIIEEKAYLELNEFIEGLNIAIIL